MEAYNFKKIATIYTDFPEKFGLPRQSGLVKSLKGKIVFEPKYRNPSAVKELESYSHIWLIWLFSDALREDWSPTVRPPRLGGNKRVGVFATRSPYRPNPIGLSAVKLEKIIYDKNLGPVLEVSGIDIKDGTPIFDIKPYLSFADSHPEAVCGFADTHYNDRLEVIISEEIKSSISKDILDKLYEILSEDPRPHYHNDPERIYGFLFDSHEIKFRVSDNVLTVISVEKQ